MQLSMIRFRCYFCHRVHSVVPGEAGKRGRCACGKMLVVPEPPLDGSAGEGPCLGLPPVSSAAEVQTWPEAHFPSIGGGPGRPAAPGKGRKGPAMLRWLLLALSLAALAGWLFFTFIDRGPEPVIPRKDLLALPAPFWSTVLFALFAGLLLEAMLRSRR